MSNISNIGSKTAKGFFVLVAPTDQQSCAYKFYQNEGNIPLVELIPPNSDILDCGCGAGDNARLLRLRGSRVTGITISPTEGVSALSHCDAVLIADLEQGLPVDASQGYDVALFSHVLEHLQYPDAVLQDARKVLNQRGLLAVALPNVLYYPVRFQFLCGKFNYTTSGILDNTHVRFYTFKTAQELLIRNGFDIVTVQGSGRFPFWRLRSILPPDWITWGNEMACKLWPGLFGGQILLLARPRQ